MKDSFGHLIGVFIHPTKSFRAIAERPSWWPPLLVLVIVGIVFVALLIPRIDWDEYLHDRYEGRDISAEELAAVTETVESGCAMWLAVPFVVVVVFPLTAWIFYMALKAFGSVMSFRQGLAVMLYGLLPSWMLSGLITIPMLIGKSSINPAALRGRDLLWSNPSFLAGDETSLALTKLLSALDVFSFWSLALLTIGFSIAGRVSKGQAATCVVGLWVLYVAVKVGLAAVGVNL